MLACFYSFYFILVDTWLSCSPCLLFFNVCLRWSLLCTSKWMGYKGWRTKLINRIWDASCIPFLQDVVKAIRMSFGEQPMNKSVFYPFQAYLVRMHRPQRVWRLVWAGQAIRNKKLELDVRDSLFGPASTHPKRNNNKQTLQKKIQLACERLLSELK